MGEDITLYGLFHTNLLTAEQLRDIATTKNLTKIIVVHDKEEVQIFYDQMFTRTFKFKKSWENQSK